MKLILLFWVSFETLEGFWSFLNLEKWLLLFCLSSGNLCRWPGWQVQWQFYKGCFLYFMEALTPGNKTSLKLARNLVTTSVLFEKGQIAPGLNKKWSLESMTYYSPWGREMKADKQPRTASCLAGKLLFWLNGEEQEQWWNKSRAFFQGSSDPYWKTRPHLLICISLSGNL